MGEKISNFIEKIRSASSSEKIVGLFFVFLLFWGIWYANVLDFTNEESHPALRLLLDIPLGSAWLAISLVFVANLKSQFLRIGNKAFFFSLSAGIMTAFFIWSGTILGVEPLGLLPQSIATWWRYENSLMASYWSVAVPLWGAYTILEFLWESKDIPMNSRIVSILEILTVCILGLAMATGFAGGFAVLGITMGVTILLVLGLVSSKIKTLFKQPKIIIIPPEKNPRYNNRRSR